MRRRRRTVVGVVVRGLNKSRWDRRSCCCHGQLVDGTRVMVVVDALQREAV